MKKLLVLLVLLAGMWQGATGQVDLQEVWRKPWTETITSAKFSPDGKYIYCAIGNTIRKMDAKTGDTLSKFDNTGLIGGIYTISFSELGNFAVSQNGGLLVSIWDIQNQKWLKNVNFSKHPGVDGALAIAMAPDESYILAYIFERYEGGDSAYIVAYDFKNDKEIARVSFNKGTTRLITISHDGKYFVSGTEYKDTSDNLHDLLLLWETGTWKQIATLQDVVVTGGYGYQLIKFSKDDKFVGVIKLVYDGLDIYDLQTFQKLKAKTITPCYCFDILPKTNYLLANYFEDEGYKMEISFLGTDNIFRIYPYTGTIVESFFTTDNRTYIYVYGDTMTKLYTIIPTIVEETTNEKIAPKIIIKNNSLILTQNINGIDCLEVSDIKGNIVFKENYTTSQYDDIEIKTKLPAGIFFCRMKTKINVFTQKIEIVR